MGWIFSTKARELSFSISILYFQSPSKLPVRKKQTRPRRPLSAPNKTDSESSLKATLPPPKNTQIRRISGAKTRPAKSKSPVKNKSPVKKKKKSPVKKIMKAYSLNNSQSSSANPDADLDEIDKIIQEIKQEREREQGGKPIKK